MPPQNEPRPAAAARRLSDLAESAGTKPARPVGKPIEFSTVNADEADRQPPQEARCTTPATAKAARQRLFHGRSCAGLVTASGGNFRHSWPRSELGG